MKLYEYQAKELLKRYDSHFPRGLVAYSPEEAGDNFRHLGNPQAVIKAQVLAGGRGKAGGIRAVNSPEEARSYAEKLIGSRLVTAQTTLEGEEVRAVLVQEVVPIHRELYVAFIVDRKSATPLLMGCPEGGVEIEEVSKRSPELIFTEPLDSLFGLHPFQARRMASSLGISGSVLRDAAGLIMNLSKAFIEEDLSLLEINPLAITPGGQLSILDVKADFDDNSSFRHPEISSIRPSPRESIEAEASSYGLNYVGLEGDIGCLVNGAGLAMATNDIIRLYGGRPANFLDVGGDATAERVAQAFRVLLEDPRLKAVLVNIFGGIVRCDTIAQAIITALKDRELKVPLVVRLEGTNSQKAREILETSGLKITFSTGMKDAAIKALDAISIIPH